MLHCPGSFAALGPKDALFQIHTCFNCDASLIVSLLNIQASHMGQHISRKKGGMLYLG